MEFFEFLRDDDYYKEWVCEVLFFKLILERGMLKFIGFIIWIVVDIIVMEFCENVFCVEIFNLEVLEVINEWKFLIGVGIVIIKGEDLFIRGVVYVYNVVDVILEFGKLEMGKKLKFIVKEDIFCGVVMVFFEIGI